MSNHSFFTPEEYDARLRRLRQAMAAQNLDGCLISVPENIYYLTGLDHFGYFAYHALLVPGQGDMVLIARAMEQATMDHFLVDTYFKGYGDSADRVAFTAQSLREMGIKRGRLGLEKQSLFLPPIIPEGLTAALPELAQLDVSGLVDRLRQTRSPQEIAYSRQAAGVAQAMMQAAIETAGAGVNEQEVAAEVQRAMALAGGEQPGFGPFIRSTARLGQEHRYWEDYVLQPGDMLFVELAGCVRRYHAAMGRLLFIGEASDGAQEMARLCLQAFQDVICAMRPGALAQDVYRAWQDRVDAAGLSHYRRHHCGYLIGLGFPPSWVGGGDVVGLRHDSDLQLQPGMTFHVMSWLMDTGYGDYFVSDTALVTEEGCERLTTTSQQLHIV
ncbi:MAG TPA: Xaa-Pro peptidase family protein [Candidatus Sulfomarinibacteraceae bacterium]|nr:Xaa-Pro peptidase family protein [Candidatus Sulfomarinibacteraceae bacterium]